MAQDKDFEVLFAVRQSAETNLRDQCSEQLCQDEPTHMITISKSNEGWILPGSLDHCLLSFSRVNCPV
jgi:hypothetical protein